jgi:hypothetical protein
LLFHKTTQRSDDDAHLTLNDSDTFDRSLIVLFSSARTPNPPFLTSRSVILQFAKPRSHMHPVVANPSAQGVFFGARRRSSNSGCSSSSSSFSSSFSFQQSRRSKRGCSFSPRNVTQNATANDNKSDDSDAEDKPLDAFLLGKALAETVLERTATEVVNFISDATNLPTKIEDEMEQLKREVEKRAKEDAGRGV